MLDHAADERGVADRELRQRLHRPRGNRESPPAAPLRVPQGNAACTMLPAVHALPAACTACTDQHFARIARIGRCREQSLVRRARPRSTSRIVLFAAPFARRHLIKKSASTFSHGTHARTHARTLTPPTYAHAHAYIRARARD